MTVESAAIRLDWLAQRCVALYPQAHQPSRREINALQRKVVPGTHESGECADALDPLLHTLESFYESMGLHAPEWRKAPTRDALPMVALLPGVGCRILYACTPEGHWLMEGPSGSQQLYHLPEGGIYSAIAAPAAAPSAPPTMAPLRLLTELPMAAPAPPPIKAPQTASSAMAAPAVSRLRESAMAIRSCLFIVVPLWFAKCNTSNNAFSLIALTDITNAYKTPQIDPGGHVFAFASA